MTFVLVTVTPEDPFVVPELDVGPFTSLVIDAGMVGVRLISGFDLVKSIAVSTDAFSDKSSAFGNCIAADGGKTAAELCGEKLSAFETEALPLESCRLRSRAASSRLTAASSFAIEVGLADTDAALTVVFADFVSPPECPCLDAKL